jgi:hypothetical protein
MKATSKTTTHRARTRTPGKQAHLDQVKAALAGEHQARERARHRLETFLRDHAEGDSSIMRARGLALAMSSLVIDLVPDDSGALFTTATVLLEAIDKHLVQMERALDAGLACGVVTPPAAPMEAGT